MGRHDSQAGNQRNGSVWGEYDKEGFVEEYPELDSYDPDYDDEEEKALHRLYLIDQALFVFRLFVPLATWCYFRYELQGQVTNSFAVTLFLFYFVVAGWDITKSAMTNILLLPVVHYFLVFCFWGGYLHGWGNFGSGYTFSILFIYSVIMLLLGPRTWRLPIVIARILIR